MSLEYVRKTYGVPAKRGGKVRYTSGIPGTDPRVGHITGASGGRLRVSFNRGRFYVIHPADTGLEYLAADGEVNAKG